MRNILYLLVAILILSACESKRQPAENTSPEQTAPPNDTAQTVADTVNFKTAFDEFFTAVQTANTDAFNKFIHPDYGLWVIEQPGALPSMTQVFRIQDFQREYQDRSFFTIAEEVQECNLTEEAFPSFDCADMNYEAGKTGFSKDGCFVWKPDKFKESGYWDYASLTPEQLQAVKSALPHVQKSVLHTKTAFEFHFGYLDGHWRLLFTKLIYPCSA